MAHSNREGVRLKFSSGRPSVTNLTDINEALGPVGSRIWPIELGDVPVAIREMLNRPTLDDAEADSVKEHFLPSRERLLQIIAEAGRTAQVSGSGEMSTLDSTNGVVYPRSISSRTESITRGSIASTQTRPAVVRESTK